jgi:myo-inositol-1(or 4)-monophosphatase
MIPSLTDLETLARGAGEILCAGFGQRMQVDYKGVIDLVTEADHRSEAYLLGEIQRRFPGHKIVAEESGEIAGADGQVWYIDPLDGTINYAHGVPIFSVSLGFAEAGDMILGVVYDPLRDECFSAERGHGALLNGHPLCVSETQSLDHGLLVTGFPYDIRTNPINNLDNYAMFAMRSQAVRRLGSAALDLCYVAAGRFDGYWEIRLKSWDVAAGALIAEQAGAVVTNLAGGADYLSPPQSVLAANPHIHPQMLALLNG